MSKKIRLFLLVVLFSVIICQTIYASTPVQNKGAILEKAYKMQIPFIANEGQVKDDSIKFYVKTFGGTAYINKKGDILYSFPQISSDKEVHAKKKMHPKSGIKSQSSDLTEKKGKGVTLKEELVGSNIKEIRGEEQAVTKVSYFSGNDPSKWKSSISTYQLVNLGEVYKGIELKLRAHGKNIEKLFYVKPTAKPDEIKVKIEGAKKIKVNDKGELEVDTELGTVAFTKPVAYQVKKQKAESKEQKEYVEVAYVIKGNEYSFKVGNYDKTKELIIDPLLASTFLGGSDEDRAASIDIDSSGNVYSRLDPFICISHNSRCSIKYFK